MTPEKLKQYGEALFGPRWQTPMARALGHKDASNLRKWISGSDKGRPIPAYVETALKTLMGLDAFIIGNGASGKEYVIHTRPPRFVATVYAPGDEALGVNDLSGITHECAGGETLCEMVWWDKPPEDAELAALMRRAEAALDEATLNATEFPE